MSTVVKRTTLVVRSVERSMTIFDPDGFILEVNQRPG